MNRNNIITNIFNFNNRIKMKVKLKTKILLCKWGYKYKVAFIIFQIKKYGYEKKNGYNMQVPNVIIKVEMLSLEHTTQIGAIYAWSFQGHAC